MEFLFLKLSSILSILLLNSLPLLIIDAEVETEVVTEGCCGTIVWYCPVHNLMSRPVVASAD